MRALFSTEGRRALDSLAGARVLLAFDFDGTLAPIVGERDRAAMRPRTSALLARICALFPCAVISGRSRDDVAARLGGAAVKYVVGNHGIEPGEDLARFEEAARRIGEELARSIAPEIGVEIEDKRYSLALHFRRAPEPERARATIDEALARSSVPVRVVAGKCVVNVVPEHAPHKGDALLRLASMERADRVLYVGDDITDEDVFALHAPDLLLTVRVGSSDDSAAGYFLHDQDEVDALLTRLIALRDHGCST